MTNEGAPKDYVQDLIQFIKNQVIREFVQKVCDKYNANETFRKSTSSSGKYHPEFSNGEGGLYRHTKIMLHIAERLIDLYKPMRNLDDNIREVVMAAIILHDLWKYTNAIGEPTRHTTKDHAYIGFLRISEFNDHNPFVVPIARAVRHHMSTFGHSDVEITAAKNVSEITSHIVMMADMIASSRIVFDVAHKFYKGES